MELYRYTLKGVPVSLYMTTAINKRIWDNIKEAIIHSQIDLERQHEKPIIQSPISLKVTFHLPKRQFVAKKPSMKSYCNFIEKVLHDSIIPKNCYIYEMEYRRVLSDHNYRTEIEIKRVDYDRTKPKGNEAKKNNKKIR